MTIVTVWERFNPSSKEWEHNHISDGYDESAEEPVAKSDMQKQSWKGGKWRSFKGELREGVVVVAK